MWRGESVEGMGCGGMRVWRGESVEGVEVWRMCVHLLWAAEVLKGQCTE